MAEATYQLDGPLAEATIPSQTSIPSDPEPGTYVVIDVASFSTTVVELLNNGASYIHITDERGDEFGFRDEHPEAKIGGGKTDDYEPTEGYDFYNSPSYVQSVDVDGRPVAMTSSNGGAAVTDLDTRGGDDVEIYISSMTNAKAIADHLRADDAETIAVIAGSNGKPSPEDAAGAILFHRYFEENPPTEPELEMLKTVVTSGKASKYHDQPDIKHRDLLEYCSAVNTRSVIPKLEDGALVDVAGNGAERE
ncbi:2-phosphosulfolactate phosphatase [Natrarchaeobius halalkaliphilus]|uniref:2-phosphosulfolactate phosphatase n=1 Tax=Natrarchaeobius halalkaliphilus TaxID=1679091 RepID=A0A3N6LYP1_9EURY|nr:2-phosphosulfolactate phosphatase [Natrarchaeobius halalkaliphilus]RQG87783.1 2-phosphosulfolactate phosphatase [Natrarchaeobius halalkaliphilus]